MKRTVLLLARFVVATLISGWVNLVEALMRPRAKCKQDLMMRLLNAQEIQRYTSERASWD